MHALSPHKRIASLSSSLALSLSLSLALLLSLFASAEAGDRIYVPSATSGTNTVSVIDAGLNSLVATVTVGTTPRGLAISPDKSLVYVANMHSNDVSVIATMNNSVIATIPVGTGPLGVAVSPTLQRAYVTNPTSNTVSVIDTGSLTVIATIAIPGPGPLGASPQGISVDPSGAFVYVANWLAKSVTVIDANSNTIVTTVSFASQIPHSQPVWLAANSSTLYVGGWSPLYIISKSSWAILGSVPMPITDSMAMSPAGDRLYIANRVDQQVSVLDTSSNTVVAVVPATSPFSGSLNASGSRYYMTSANSFVEVMDTATFAVTATSALAPSGAFAFGNSYVHSDPCEGLTAAPSPLVFPKPGGSLILNVTAPATCKWFLSPASPAPWLSFSPSGAIGSATVIVTAQANGRAPRGVIVNLVGVGLGATATSISVGQF